MQDQKALHSDKHYHYPMGTSYLLVKFSSYTPSLGQKVQLWAFILSSTVPDPLKMATLKGLQIRSGP